MAQHVEHAELATLTDTPEDNDLKTKQQVETCGFAAIRKRGQGTYGLVYEIGDAKGDLFAFKYILPDATYETAGLDSLNEIDILSRVNHPYIIHSAQIVTSHNCKIDGIAVILPLADRTLFNLINDVRATTDQKLPIFYKLATALDFLHSNHILHLDIKSTNVVLQDININHPFLIDFGLSLIVDDAKTGVYNHNTRVTIDHRAPEILAGSRIYNAAVDVWAFGIMMLYILSVRGVYDVDFASITPEDLGLVAVTMFTNPDIFDGFLAGVRDKYRNQCKDLLRGMLQVDSTQRITARQIMDHPVFDDFRHPVQGYLNEPYIPYDYAIDQRDILKILIHWTKTLYPEARAELIFLAVDLFNRVAGFYRDRTPIDRMTLAAACLWVAAKLTSSKSIPLNVYVPEINKIVPNITTNGILDTEIEIIHLQNGILHISKLYRECTTANELIHSFQYVILDRDSTLYARVDVTGWIDEMKKLPIVSEQQNKNITVAELLP
ncbi:Protein kinase [uncultured virus]|nr:Protein kinase [uncultured virus]